MLLAECLFCVNVDHVHCFFVLLQCIAMVRCWPLWGSMFIHFIQHSIALQKSIFLYWLPIVSHHTFDHVSQNCNLKPQMVTGLFIVEPSKIRKIFFFFLSVKMPHLGGFWLKNPRLGYKEVKTTK